MQELTISSKSLPSCFDEELADDVIKIWRVSGSYTFDLVEDYFGRSGIW